MRFNKSVSLFILTIFLLSFIHSAQTVQVIQEQPPEKKGWFDTYLGFLKSPIFWYIFVGVILFILICIGLFFLIRWLVKYLKSRANIFWKLKSERIKLAKIHKRYPAKHWWKVSKNLPIRLVRKENNGKLYISNPIAYYRGDYTTHEGNVVLCMNLKEDRRFLFFPITSLLIIPNKDSIEFFKKDKKGRIEKVIIGNLPKANDIIQFNDNEILVYAESFSAIGMFHAPVLKAKDGKIIDLALPVYDSLRDVVLEEYLFEQTDEFAKVSKKSIDLNPHLRYEVKAGDSSGHVEVPQGEPK